MPENSPVRLGFIKYLNAWPLYMKADPSPEARTLAVAFEGPEYSVTKGAPAEINSLMAAGECDIATISAAHYLRGKDDYQLLGCGGISAFGPVMSVMLVSTCEIPALGGKKVLLTDESESSAELLKILLTEFHGLSGVRFDSGGVEPGDLLEASWRKGYDAVLVIGDPALRAREILGSRKVFFCRDLAEEWKNFTMMPFVFGVVAARKDFYFSHPARCREFGSAMKKCAAAFAADRARFSSLAAGASGMDPAMLAGYYALLDYEFGFEHTAGLEEFETRMKKLPPAGQTAAGKREGF